MSKILTLLLFFCLASPTLAETPEPYIPEALKQWVPWIQEKFPEKECTLLSDKTTCSWPGKLSLNIDSSGGTFSYIVSLDRFALVSLPGGKNSWPQNVSISKDGATVESPVVEKNQRPHVRLSKGEYRVTGSFTWQAMPELLMVPERTALIDATVDGVSLPTTNLSSNGELWLRKVVKEDASEVDTMNVSIFRRLEDNIPFSSTTWIDLRIGGKAREIQLGNILLQGFFPRYIQSPLPYRISTDNSLTVQARPGQYTIEIHAITESSQTSLSSPALTIEGLNPTEYWIWQPNEELRSVELTGLSSIDPSRTSIPQHLWNNNSIYVAEPGQTLSLKETRRGEVETAPNTLSIARTVWLSHDGNSMTVEDNLSGTMNKDFRLTAHPLLVLGRVSVNGVDQLITSDSEKNSGVEVRNREIQLKAISKINNAPSTIPAVGWNHDVNSLKMDLRLPPGWSLFDVRGVDFTSDSWFSRWTLLHCFGVLLITIATGKLFGKRIGVLALIVLILTHDEAGAPFQLWFHLLASTALLKVVKDHPFRKCILAYHALTLAGLAVVVLPFVLLQIQVGLFPQLGTPIYLQNFQLAQTIVYTLLLPLAGTAAIFGVLAGVVFLFKGKWKELLSLVLGFILFASLLGLLQMTLSRGGNFRSYDYDEGSYTASGFDAMKADAPYGAGAVPQAAPSAAMQEGYLDSESEMVATRSLRQSVKQSPSNYFKEQPATRNDLLKIDPNAIVQTGPGIPSWRWRSWNLSWNGPVDKSHEIKLLLIGPKLNLVLSLVRIGLLIWLSFVFLKGASVFTASKQTQKAILLLFLLGIYTPQTTHAQSFPSEEMLSELEKRLYQHDCKENCTQASNVSLRVSGERLTLSAQVHSDTQGAWALPGPLDQLYPETVSLNGTETLSLQRGSDGIVWVRVPKGVHTIEMNARLPERNTVSLQFSIPPQHLTIEAPNWEIVGLSPQGTLEGSLQLSRKVGHTRSLTKEAAQDEVLLPEWFLVERNIEIGVPWSISTTVTRFTNLDRPTSTSVSLLQGETPTSGAVKVENGLAQVSFPRNSSVVQWNSSLKETSLLTLTARADGRYNERWFVGCSVMWHCKSEGIAPVSSVQDGIYRLLFQPWAGENVSVKVARPEAVPGETVTIDSVNTEYHPGLRALSSKLTLKVRSSVGGFHTINLPENAEVEKIFVDGIERNIRPDKTTLSLPLAPQAQEYVIDWRMPWTLSSLMKLPGTTPLMLGASATNVTLKVHLLQDRWILLAWGSGSGIGPVILFWGELLLVGIVAFLLGKYNVASIRFSTWLLLGLGLLSLPLVIMCIPPVWLWLISYRQSKAPQTRLWFNGLQVLLVLMTLATIGALYGAVGGGLVGNPDMMISGGGSTNWILNWYYDATTTELPTLQILAVPIWVWRVFMFAWSSWLAVSLISWLRKAWDAFSSGEMWKSKAEASEEVKA